MSNILRANKGGITGFPGKFKMETRIVPGSVITPLLLFNVRNPVDKYNYGPTLAGEDAVFVDEYEDQVPYHGPGTNYVIPSKAGILLINPDTTDVEIIKPDFSDSIHDTIFPQSGPRISNVSVDEENEVIVIDTSAVGFVTDFEFNLLEVLDYSDGYKTAVYLDGNRYYLYGVDRIPRKTFSSKPAIQIISVQFTPTGDLVVIEELDSDIYPLYAIHVLDADAFLSETANLPPGYENVDVTPYIVQTFYSDHLGLTGPVNRNGVGSPYAGSRTGDETKGVSGPLESEAQGLFNIDYLSNGDMIVADTEYYYNEYADSWPGNNSLSWLPRISRISLRTGKVKWRQYATPEHVPGEQENYYSISGLFVDEQDNIVCSLIPIPINPDDVRQLLVLNADGEQLHRQSLDVTNLTIGEKPKRLNKLGFRITFHPHPVLPLPNAVGVATWKASQHEDHHEYVIYLNETEIARTQALTTQIEGIELGAEYTFRIASVSQTGQEISAFEFTDSAEVLPPSVITEFTSFFDNGEIRLAWEDPAHGNTAFINIYQDGVLLDKLAPGTESYIISGLDKLTEYLIEVRVENELGVVGGAVARADVPYKVFIEDFSSTPIGQTPIGWTLRNNYKDISDTPDPPNWVPKNFTVKVVGEATALNGKALRYTPGTTVYDHGLFFSWDMLDGYESVIMEVRWRSVVESNNIYTGIGTGYFGGIDTGAPSPNNFEVGLQKYIGSYYENSQWNTQITKCKLVPDGTTAIGEIYNTDLKRQDVFYDPTDGYRNIRFGLQPSDRLIYLNIDVGGESGPGKVLGVDYNAIEIDYVKVRLLQPEL